VFTTPNLELRLQRRYQQLVTEQMNPTQAVAAGLRALPAGGAAFASTQAAWRFYANPAVSLPHLVEPLITSAKQMHTDECGDFALLIHDWSELNYDLHTRKADRIAIRHKSSLGYSLQTALLISDRDGTPIAPLAFSLWASDGLYTTRQSHVMADCSHLDEITDTLTAISEMQLPKPAVHLIDRAADSVGHYRQWNDQGQSFVVRARAVPQVEFEGETMRLGRVAAGLSLRLGQAVAIAPGIVGQQLLAETNVTITRPAFPHRQKRGIKQQRERVYGKPLQLRLVVSRIVLADETVYAEWLLLTNLPEAVAAERIAQWYVWRWKVESYFKLLKSSGHNLEHWQQESAEAIAKRLVVTAMAAVVIWQLARSQAPESEQARNLLVRLSGRQMRRDRPVTESAMLAGLWTLLATLSALEQYSLDELRQVARLSLPGFFRYDTG
jgi:hypothetical protein